MFVDVTLSTGVELEVEAALYRDQVEDYRVVACNGKRVRANVHLSAKADSETMEILREKLAC